MNRKGVRSFPFVSNGAESVYGVKPEDIMNDAEMTVFRTPIVRAYRKPFEDSVRQSYKTMPVAVARVCDILQSEAYGTFRARMDATSTLHRRTII